MRVGERDRCTLVLKKRRRKRLERSDHHRRLRRRCLGERWSLLHRRYKWNRTVSEVY